MLISFVFRFAFVIMLGFSLMGCLGYGEAIAPATKQLPAEAQALLATKGMKAEAPIFIRIFKEESELEVWKKMDDGRYAHFKTYPICKWSGELGPKVVQGDKQAPEGFYTVRPGQMNPNSMFHLAFNLGYPNKYDQAHGRTGSALMVHGKCKSAGCFAMTDALIEEIYILAREAFKGGQTAFHVNAFPFRMTDENMKRHASNKWISFWRSLKTGYDSFEFYRVPPKVAVCSKQYLVNVNFMGIEAEPDPQAPCPAFKPISPDDFYVPSFENLPGQPQQVAQTPRTLPQVASAERPAPVAQPEPETRTAAYVPQDRDPYAIAGTQPVSLSAMQPAPPVVIAAEPAPPPVVAVASPVTDTAAVFAQENSGQQQSTRRSGKGDRLAPPPAAAPAPAATGLSYAPASSN